MSEPKTQTIHLLVTLNGEQGSVSIDQVVLDRQRITHAYMLVSGRSMSDVIRCIETAALRSQGRKTDTMRDDKTVSGVANQTDPIKLIAVPVMPFEFGDARFRALYGPENEHGGRPLVGVVREDMVSLLEGELEKALSAPKE